MDKAPHSPAANDRQARLAAQLRANLRRRKAQDRAQADSSNAEGKAD